MPAGDGRRFRVHRTEARERPRSAVFRVPRFVTEKVMATTITAADVKKLRDQTGAGMMDCKGALEEANGNFDEATTILRKKGLASAAKKAGRAANEGLIAHKTAADHTSGILAEVNCESDFVSATDDF